MTLEYRPGLSMDVFGDEGAPAVLLWHGSGPREREVLHPLARSIAAAGVRVHVPDWDSTAPDMGRLDLLASLQHVGATAADLTLVGWSLGGTAAVSAAIDGCGDGWHVRGAVGLAAALNHTDPLTGLDLARRLRERTVRVPVRLLQGSEDDIVRADEERVVAEHAARVGSDLTFTVIPGDHATIVGTRFDEGRDLCVPTNDPAALNAMRAATELVATLSQQ